MKKLLLSLVLICSAGNMTAHWLNVMAIPFGVVGGISLFFSGHIKQYLHADLGSEAETKAGIFLVKCLGVCGFALLLGKIGNMIDAKKAAAAKAAAAKEATTSQTITVVTSQVQA